MPIKGMTPFETCSQAGNGKFYVEMGNKQMAESSSGTLALSGNKGEAEQWSFIAM